jgi:exosome complex component RRP42
MSSIKKSMIVEHLRKAQMIELLAKGKRLDGRGLEDYRNVKIECGIIQKAEGSARVTIGNTQVIAGVKIEVGEPFPDTPNNGVLVVNSEVLPLASPYAEPGPPDEDAIELSRVVDRGVRAAEMVDLKSLVLEEGKKVYTIFVDVNVLDIDGNLFDASSYAVVTSLLTSKLPVYEKTSEGWVKKEEYTKLPTTCIPISVTLARIGDVLLVDPTAEEEAVMDARITLTTDEDGNLVAAQKGNPGSLSVEQVFKAAEIATEKGKEIREIIRRATGVG